LLLRQVMRRNTAERLVLQYNLEALPVWNCMHHPD
jgi:pentatricopeptide repeat domain-containing protein 1